MAFLRLPTSSDSAIYLQVKPYHERRTLLCTKVTHVVIQSQAAEHSYTRQRSSEQVRRGAGVIFWADTDDMKEQDITKSFL